jgi:hypothetical protein
MPTMRLTRSQTDDLAAVCAIGAEKLESVIHALEALGPTIKRSKLRRAIEEQVRDETASEALERFLFALATIQRRGRGAVPDILDNISHGLVAQKWDQQQLNQWQVCSEVIARLLKSAAVLSSSKAIDLSYDFARIYLAARIITDVRPIFDELREEIIGNVITQTLRIDYTSSEGTESTISVAMDTDDIQQLLRSCEGAVSKATTIRRAIENEWEKEAIMTGEEIE